MFPPYTWRCHLSLVTGHLSLAAGHLSLVGGGCSWRTGQWGVLGSMGLSEDRPSDSEHRRVWLNRPSEASTVMLE